VRIAVEEKCTMNALFLSSSNFFCFFVRKNGEFYDAMVLSCLVYLSLLERLNGWCSLSLQSVGKERSLPMLRKESPGPELRSRPCHTSIPSLVFRYSCLAWPAGRGLAGFFFRPMSLFILYFPISIFFF